MEEKVKFPLLKGYLAMIHPEGQPSNQRGQKQAKAEPQECCGAQNSPWGWEDLCRDHSTASLLYFHLHSSWVFLRQVTKTIKKIKHKERGLPRSAFSILEITFFFPFCLQHGVRESVGFEIWQLSGWIPALSFTSHVALGKAVDSFEPLHVKTGLPIRVIVLETWQVSSTEPGQCLLRCIEDTIIHFPSIFSFPISYSLKYSQFYNSVTIFDLLSQYVQDSGCKNKSLAPKSSQSRGWFKQNINTNYWLLFIQHAFFEHT